MTIRELFDLGRDYPWLLTGWFVLLPAFAWALTFLHEPASAGKSPWRYVYAVLVYLACVPGMMALLVATYETFFIRGNLLERSIVTYVLPIVSMLAMLVVVHRAVDFDRLPGVKRLWGFMVVLAVAVGLALIVDKTRIWIFFGGTILSFFVVLGVAFVLLLWGMHAAFRGAAPDEGEPAPASVMPPPPEPPETKG